MFVIIFLKTDKTLREVVNLINDPINQVYDVTGINNRNIWQDSDVQRHIVAFASLREARLEYKSTRLVPHLIFYT